MPVLIGVDLGERDLDRFGEVLVLVKPSEDGVDLGDLGLDRGWHQPLLLAPGLVGGEVSRSERSNRFEVSLLLNDLLLLKKNYKALNPCLVGLEGVEAGRSVTLRLITALIESPCPLNRRLDA